MLLSKPAFIHLLALVFFAGAAEHVFALTTKKILPTHLPPPIQPVPILPHDPLPSIEPVFNPTIPPDTGPESTPTPLPPPSATPISDDPPPGDEPTDPEDGNDDGDEDPQEGGGGPPIMCTPGSGSDLKRDLDKC